MIEDHQLLTLRDTIGNAFSNGMPQFPHYTLHGKEHLNELDRLCLLICGCLPEIKDDIQKINLLRLAIILHDYAMVNVPTPDREKKLRSQMDPSHSFADIIRITHQDEIIESLKNRAEELYTVFSGATTFEMESAVTIAQYHRFHLLDEAPEHLKGLCALMRLLDELDIGPSRAPREAYRVQRTRMDEVSRFHWLKHICCIRVDKGTTFRLESINNRISLRILVAVLATENSWRLLQREILQKLQSCVVDESVANIIHDEFGARINIEAMPEKRSICGVATLLSHDIAEDLEEIAASPTFINRYTKPQPINVYEDLEEQVQNSPIELSRNQLTVYAIPPEKLFEHLSQCGRLSIIGNRYIKRLTTNMGGTIGALNRIYLGPADCGKTREAAEWIHQLTYEHPAKWVVLRTNPGNVPRDVDRNVILDRSQYSGIPLPQNAILFLDDLPENLPLASSNTDDNAIRRLFSWFKNQPDFHETRVVATIRLEDLHSRPNWPEILPSIGTEIELLRLSELSEEQYASLWRGMNEGTIFISQTDGEKEFSLKMDEEFITHVVKRSSNPEGVAMFIFGKARDNIVSLSTNDARDFHFSAVETWLSDTWPAMRDSYGIAARVFHTLARFLEAGLRSGSDFTGSLSPLWEFHEAFGQDLCAREGDEGSSYLESIRRIGQAGHAVGENRIWIRPRWDYLLQAETLQGVELALPDIDWFVERILRLNPQLRLQLAKHFITTGWSITPVICDDAYWLMGLAAGKYLQAYAEKKTSASRHLYKEALSVYDIVIERFGDDYTPEMRENVAAAFTYKGSSLLLLKWYEKALRACDEMIELFGNDETPEIHEHVASTLVYKMNSLIQLERYEKALAACDEMIELFDDNHTPKIRGKVVVAFISKAVSLGRLERDGDALAVYDIVIERFGDDDTPEIRENVATAFIYKGICLEGLKQNGDALAVYDILIERFSDYETPPIQWNVAIALINKGRILTAQERYEEAVSIYNIVIDRFADDETPEMLENVAAAFAFKGSSLVQLERYEKVVTACDKMIELFGDDENPEIREHVSTALIYKAISFEALDRIEVALAVYENVIERFGHDETPGMSDNVAMALICKGRILRNLERDGNALAVFDIVIKRFSHDETPKICEHVSTAFIFKGSCLEALKQDGDALTVYDIVIERFGHYETPTMQWNVATALIRKGSILKRLERMKEAISAFEDCIARFGENVSPDMCKLIGQGLSEKSAALVCLWRNTSENSLLFQAITSARESVLCGANPYNLSCALVLNGELTEAFKLLEVCLHEDQIKWSHISEDPDWDSVRKYRLYLELENKYGSEVG